VLLASLVAVAVAPALALLLFFYARDRYRKEPLWQLLVTFLLGAAILIPAAVSSIALQRFTGWNSSTSNLLHLFLGALLIVGLVEEGWKFVVVRVYSYVQRDFDEPYDGIMYAVSASLGFATVENLLYVLGGGLRVGLLRALLAVPGHAFYAVLMGYFLGEAKFTATRLRSGLLQLSGLGLAVLAHGVYDFIVFSMDEKPLMAMVLPVFAALAWAVFFRATKLQADKSFHRRPGLAALGSVERDKEDGPADAGPEPED